MRDFTQVYLSKKTPDYKMTHQLFTLFWIISNILTFHFYTFSVIYTFYFYIAFEELTFYQKCSIKCVLYSLFYICIWVWCSCSYLLHGESFLLKRFWPVGYWCFYSCVFILSKPFDLSQKTSFLCLALQITNTWD